MASAVCIDGGSPSSSDEDDAGYGVWRVSERSRLFASTESGKGSPATRSAGEETEVSQVSTVISAESPHVPQPDPDAPLMDDAYFFSVLYTPQIQGLVLVVISISGFCLGSG